MYIIVESLLCSKLNLCMMNSADKLLEIYERLKRLKQNGVKMKDIASTIE